MLISTRLQTKLVLRQGSRQCEVEDVFATLTDTVSVEILKAAYTGFKSSRGLAGQSKSQYFNKLKRLADMGLLEKKQSNHKLTTFGLLVYKNHLEIMEKLISNYWQIKNIDVLKNRDDFPPDRKEDVIGKYVATTDLSDVINPTQLTSYNIVGKFDKLIPEVMKVLDNAMNEVYFATRYYDPHVSNMVFNKLSKGVNVHILDGNPDQISVEKRLAAIIRTPPNKQAAEMIKSVLKSSRFDLKRLSNLPLSFIVVDGIQVVYETVNFINPDQFTVAVSKYDDPYFAQRFIEYFELMSKDATMPKLLPEGSKGT
jgi:predicted transcriptional regulator